LVYEVIKLKECSLWNLELVNKLEGKIAQGETISNKNNFHNCGFDSLPAGTSLGGGAENAPPLFKIVIF